MNYKNKVFLTTILLTSLVSCGNKPISSSTNLPSSTIEPSSSSSISSSSSSSSSSSIEKPAPTVLPYRKLKELNDMPTLPSTGDVNMLVIPVAFKGDKDTCNAMESSCDLVKENLHQTFFGESNEENGNESVSSFYKKSSYGKLNLKGEISEVYELPRTVNEYCNLMYSRYGTSKVYDSNAFYTQLRVIEATIINGVFGDSTSYNNINYDNDGDGLIDGVWFVYLEDYLSSNSTYVDYYEAKQQLLWAFTYWNFNSNVKLGTFGWGSYKFTVEGGYSHDSHTFIHETGHMLGLYDYYDYDSQAANPTGGLDMMDYNVLDHNAYSKYILDWTTPTYVNEEGTYTLKPFQENGQFLLLNMNWNKTYYDKYLLLEYYTPTGLNRFDTENTDNKYLHGFTENGVKAYLVDSRVGAIILNGMSNKKGTWDKNFYYDFDESSFTISITYDLIYSNTPSRSYDGNVTTWNPHPLIRLLEATGNNRFVVPGNQQTADNSTLFQEGDSISSSLNMYNDETLGFNISFGKCTDEGVTITITK